MKTRIFKVSYLYDHSRNGKITNSRIFESHKLIANDAVDAIKKTQASERKPFKYKDENKKIVNVEIKNFDPIEVVLLAETD